MFKYLLITFWVIFVLIGTGLSQVNTEKFREDMDTTGFSGNADISATAITGNTDFQIINGTMHLNYNFGKDYTFFEGNAGYGWQDKEAFSNEALAHLRYVMWLNDFFQLEFFTQFDYNKKRLLLARELAGAGIRLKLITEKSLKIRYGLAYMFEREEYDLPANSVHERITNANRLSSYATCNILLKDGFSFLSVIYFQPKLNEWNDYKMISDNTFDSEISTLININFGVSLRYDSHPPVTIKKLDTISRFGLTFKF